MVVALLGDKTPKELGFGTFRKSERPILSSTVDRVVTVPYMNGAYDFGADMGPKQFNLECAFIARNHLELQQRISALATYLLDGNGRPRTMPLIFSNEPDKQYMVRLSGSLPIDRMYGLGVFTLPLVAYDPFAYQIASSVEFETWDSDLTWDTDVTWDDSYSFDFTTPGMAQIKNYGALNVGPTIEVTGSFSTLSIAVGEVVTTYNSPINNQTLTLDFKKKTAKIGTTNVLKYTNGKFGYLPVGTSDLIVSGTNLNISIDVIFNAKYPS